MLAAGKLVHRVTLQAKVRTDVGGGSRETSWSDLATVCAQVVAPVAKTSDAEKLIGGVQRGTQLWRVTIRMRSGLDPAMRILWPACRANGGRDVAMNVHQVQPSDDGRDLVIIAESGVAG